MALGGDPVRTEPILRYRGRAIGPEELAFVRRAINEYGSRSRLRLKQAICEAWGWRQRNGELSISGCNDLLNRLNEWGHIRLPVLPGCGRRGIRRRGDDCPRLLPEYTPLSWYPLGPNDIDLNEVAVRPIFPEEADGWRLFIDRYHYLGARQMVGEQLRYVATAGTELVALLAWCAAALHVPARDEFIGWNASRKRDALHFVVNNARYWVPQWVRKPHLASKVLALNLRRLSSDWMKTYGHPVYLAETFVDSKRFRGTCYRASNWLYLGRTAGRRRSFNAYYYDSTPKDVYVYELNRHAKRRILGENP